MAQLERYIPESGGEYLASEITKRTISVELTQAEYDALSDDEKNSDTVFYITDADPSQSGGTAKPMTWDNIQNKPDFAAVATSGSYNDLKDKPTATEGYDDTALSGRVSAVEGLLDGHTVGKDVPSDAVFTDTVYDDASLASRVTSNEAAIQTLNGTGNGSVQKTVTDKIAEVVANAPEDYDTLKEIADYIASDKTCATQLSNAVAANTSALGGHTVGANVPADAKFTDTVYDDTALAGRMTAAETAISEKQDKLIAGDGITIASDGKTISGVTQAQIQSAVETLIESGVVDISGYFKNNLTTTESGYALDARQGKVLNEKIVTSITQDGATFNAKNINGNNLFSFSQPASHTYTVLNGELLQDSLTLTNFTFQSGGLNKVVHGKLCMFNLSANFTMVDDSVKEYAIANIKFPTNLLPTAYKTNRIYRPVFSSYLSGEQLNSSSSPDVFISTDGCVNISTGNRKKTLSGTTYIETLFRCIYILQ